MVLEQNAGLTDVRQWPNQKEKKSVTESDGILLFYHSEVLKHESVVRIIVQEKGVYLVYSGRRKYNDGLSEHQAALKAPTNPKVTSRLEWECQRELENLVDQNIVTLLWVLGHSSEILGNEKADELARKESSTPFIVPEPALGV
ncbi:hypothetical protein NQ317_016621 [Molorchus minor]|uniref:RNase H type-1 domain-containing protein n=1 Tax=Molorchus minor TaxID=1323400 RepID=A0ABQ9IRW3_9CUCU|nr:hypothetical protein NQ317_016621 [Molorchus minor]